jgi:glutaredoxin 3
MLELYGTRTCPYTSEMREWLEWKGEEFIEYDVENDREAQLRFQKATNGQRVVPVLVENGRVVQSGWQGRMCMI